jgi:hypothetical protein
VSARAQSFRPADAVAGILCALALLLGSFALFYRPFRLAPIAFLLALIATAMSQQQRRLAAVTVALTTIFFFVGVSLQVYLSHRLF